MVPKWVNYFLLGLTAGLSLLAYKFLAPDCATVFVMENGVLCQYKDMYMRYDGCQDGKLYEPGFARPTETYCTR